MQLVQTRARDASELRAGERSLGPRRAGRARLETGDGAGEQALFGEGRRDAGILEDAVENGGRGGTNLVGHAGHGRRGGGARLACDKGAAQEQHEQEARGDRLLLLLGAGHDGHGLVLGRLLVRGEVVDEDVVVPLVAAHVEVVHLGGEVGEGGAGCDGHVAGAILETLGKHGDLLAELARLERVVADEFFLVKLQLVDHVMHVHGLAMPVLFLGNELVVLDAHGRELILHVAHLLDPALLLFLELLCVLLLALSRVEAAKR